MTLDALAPEFRPEADQGLTPTDVYELEEVDLCNETLANLDMLEHEDSIVRCLYELMAQDYLAATGELDWGRLSVEKPDLAPSREDLERFDSAARRMGLDVTKPAKTPRQRLLKAADVPGADAHPLMKSDADRLRDARWGAKLNGWLAAVRSSPPRYCLCAGFAVGDMLRCEGGCDGWFHLACLGLTAAPAGVWRCDACATGPAKRRSLGDATNSPPRPPKRPRAQTPALYSFADVARLGANGLARSDAAALRASRACAVAVTAEGTVALRALERGRQLWDASAPYSPTVPAEEPSDRYLALEVSRTRVGYFQLGPLDDDRTDAWAASYFVNAARGRVPNARFETRVDAAGRSVLGLGLLDDVPPGGELLVAYDHAAPMARTAAEDVVDLCSPDE